MMKYIDIHGHINFSEYDADRGEVIKRAHDAGVGIVVVGSDLESSRKCVELAEQNEEVWAIVGMHPTHAAGFGEGDLKGERGSVINSFDVASFGLLARHPKVVAIGECGLDYFHSKPGDIAHQREVFIQHIEMANAVNKPLMLHVRNAAAKKVSEIVHARLGVEVSPDIPLVGFEGESYDPQKSVSRSAYHEAIQILKDHAEVPADFHFFAGTTQDMNDALAVGCSISFTGVITFARNYDEAIHSVPLDKLMTETDCPYVAPIPYRGKRNEPVYVIEVVKQIAKIRSEDEDNVARQVLENAKKFFKLSI